MLILFMQLRPHHKEIITRDGLLIDQFISSMTCKNVKPIDVVMFSEMEIDINFKCLVTVKCFLATAPVT